MGPGLARASAVPAGSRPQGHPGQRDSPGLVSSSSHPRGGLGATEREAAGLASSLWPGMHTRPPGSKPRDVGCAEVRASAQVCVGSRGGRWPLCPSLSLNGVCILCLPCSQMMGISSHTLGATIDLEPPPQGKQTHSNPFCLSDRDHFL